MNHLRECGEIPNSVRSPYGGGSDEPEDDPKDEPELAVERYVRSGCLVTLEDETHARVNGRGPFTVTEVGMDPPESIQRSEQAVTARLSHIDTETEWVVIHWTGDPDPWLYVRTDDARAKRGYRYRKVEVVDSLAALTATET
ncbi:hypothetical protein ACYJ1Y_15875 [Natrialbaceae archaeon A-gly3]